jgi:methyl-accepting chemotaxis protein
MIMKAWLRGIRGKLLIIIAVSSVCILAINVFSFIKSEETLKNVNAITEIRMPSIKGLEAMNEGQTAIMLSLSIMEKHLNEPALLKKYAQTFDNKFAQIKKGRELYDPLPQSEDEAQEYNQNFTKAWAQWETDAHDIYSTLMKNETTTIKAKLEKTEESFIPAEDSLSKIIKINYKNADLDKANAEKSISQLIKTGLTMGVLGLIIVITFSISLASKLSQSLTKLAKNIQSSTEEISSASTQVASSASELSQSATEQSASLEETTASLEEISSMVAKSTENSESVSNQSNQSQAKAERGKNIMDQMLLSINEISSSNETVAEQMNESNKKFSDIITIIQEIKDKTNVINDIVFQTKLLSFNASVEAARAGEHGKGFAVVAEEVGNLAAMSGNSAKEISQMLEESAVKVQSIVNESKTQVDKIVTMGKEKIENGVKISKECATILDEIVTQVQTVASLSQEIFQASKEQSTGVLEITKAMGQLENVNQQNTMATQEVASASEMLSTQTHSLKAIVEDLMVIVEGAPVA